MGNSDPECEYDGEEIDEGKDDRYTLVVGFTKETVRQFVKIHQHSDGSIYVGFAYHGQSPHFSYHASGETHTVNIDDKGKKVITNSKMEVPLAHFQGVYSLGTWVVASRDFSLWKELTVAKERKTQAVFCLDMSRLTGLLNINCNLLERERVDLLSKMVRDIPANVNPQSLVITTTNPWIVIRVMTV